MIKNKKVRGVMYLVILVDPTSQKHSMGGFTSEPEPGSQSQQE